MELFGIELSILTGEYRFGLLLLKIISLISVLAVSHFGQPRLFGHVIHGGRTLCAHRTFLERRVNNGTLPLQHLPALLQPVHYLCLHNATVCASDMVLHG